MNEKTLKVLYLICIIWVLIIFIICILPFISLLYLWYFSIPTITISILAYIISRKLKQENTKRDDIALIIISIVGVIPIIGYFFRLAGIYGCIQILKKRKK